MGRQTMPEFTKVKVNLTQFFKENYYHFALKNVSFCVWLLVFRCS